MGHNAKQRQFPIRRSYNHERGGSMRSKPKFLALVGLGLFFAASCYGATVSGTVKGPDGAPVEGAFIQAQNTKTKMSFFVLSDRQGHYSVEKLPAGDYPGQGKAKGFPPDPQSGVALTAEPDLSREFALPTGIARWNQ